MLAQKPSRPTGVAILAVLDLLGGIALILFGGLLAAAGGSSMLSSYGYGAYTGIAAGFGLALAVGGLLALLVGWGLWTGRGWAWTLGVVLYGIGLVFSIVGLVTGGASVLVSLVIDAIILWYLFRPHVKAYFGKGSAMAQPAPSTTTV
jgi:Predicted membrane protein (DUF2127)